MFQPDGPSLRELTVQALSSTERGYDLLAPKFDLTPFRTPEDLLEQVAPHIGEVGSALDVCCGTGAGLRMLEPLTRDRLVGIDVSEGMLAEARRQLGPGVELWRGDVLTHAFRPEFDVAVCFGAFGHIESHDQPRFAEQVHRALVPGGRFVFVTREPPPLLSRTTMVYRGFNAVMRVRNALISPPFIMYYLNFLLPRATEVLERAGFEVEARHGVFEGPFGVFALVVATKR